MMNSPIRSIAWRPSGSMLAAYCQTCCIPFQTSSVTSTPAARAFSANRVKSESRVSSEPTWMSSGGRPAGSAKSGETSGARRSAPPAYICTESRRPLEHKIGSGVGRPGFTRAGQVGPRRETDGCSRLRQPQLMQVKQQGQSQPAARRVPGDRDLTRRN